MRVKLKSVTKLFYNVASSPILWNEVLEHPDYRIWGAKKVGFFYNKTSKEYKFDENQSLDHPLDQLKKYHEISKNLSDLEDYFARLMKGGPLAFSKIPQILNIEDPQKLIPTDMEEPILRGKTLAGQSFLALRISDQLEENPTPKVLVFINIDKKWIQKANDYWSEKQLNLEETDVLNYFLAILKGEKPKNYTFTGFRQGIKLV